MQFEALAEPPEGTKLTLNVTAPPVVFVTVNLSMIVLQFVDVYWVVCAFSACFGGIIFFAVTVIIIYQVGICRVVPLSLIVIHFVGFPATGEFNKVPAKAPEPLVNVADVASRIV